MALFRCEHLTKIIDDYRLNDINFNIEPGTVMGLVGINGTGKTTLIRSILGSYNLDETIDLLKKPGYELSSSSRADLIFRYCIEQGIYSHVDVNALLFKFDQPLLGGQLA